MLSVKPNLTASFSEWLHLQHDSPHCWTSVLSLSSLPGLAYLLAPHSLARPASNLAGLLSLLSLLLAGLSWADLGLASALSLARLLFSR